MTVPPEQHELISFVARRARKHLEKGLTRVYYLAQHDTVVKTWYLLLTLAF